MTIMKLIRCKVATDKRAAFCAAQQAWQPMADCDGFIAQLGGWVIAADNPNADNIDSAAPSLEAPDINEESPALDAIIVGIWQSEADLRQFMAREHDRILEQSQQQASYISCKVKRFNIIDIDTSNGTQPNSSGPLLSDSDSQLLQIIQFDGVTEIDMFINKLAAIKHTALQQEMLPTENLQQGKPTSRSPAALSHPPLSVNLWQGVDDDGCLLLSTLWSSPLDYQQYCHSAAYERLQSQLSARCDSMQVSAIKVEALWDI
ncbi:hypothetical protein Sden_1426 [Shewanella denitrificans OS217]|jgi:hypothetical protein|uniref:DUF4937 domain-containing protein n=1 Tax=Shewanella denitrificans (strain OS217 / ATCC BAA-1090 / DSM 15013) TaxID=318161 RepID=Q12PB4_SHEDO|nr:DUF4937 domain-containing protein [Shewanella denitrificans]ABE54712.1 hypothetical protein Sden_1426 [Shewanella denitrificans OS217]